VTEGIRRRRFELTAEHQLAGSASGPIVIGRQHPAGFQIDEMHLTAGYTGYCVEALTAVLGRNVREPRLHQVPGVRATVEDRGHDPTVRGLGSTGLVDRLSMRMKRPRVDRLGLTGHEGPHSMPWEVQHHPGLHPAADISSMKVLLSRGS
jgi:hypothetical protein